MREVRSNPLRSKTVISNLVTAGYLFLRTTYRGSAISSKWPLVILTLLLFTGLKAAQSEKFLAVLISKIDEATPLASCIARAHKSTKATATGERGRGWSDRA